MAVWCAGTDVYFCGRCKRADAPVFSGHCSTCGPLKKSEVKRVANYAFFLGGQSRISAGLGLSKPGIYAFK